MTPERWQQVKNLVEAALERKLSDRAAFLDLACAGDPSLRTEVESCLGLDEPAATIGEAPVFEATTKVLIDDPTASVTGRRIGPYKILHEIGQGGMGAVYLAVRADEQYHKRVAIKLVRRGMDTEDILRRFRQERQILAGLDHPIIARLLDGGTTENGLPYFVMEYIEGQPIDQYCDRHKLATVERLKLFRTVCAAVHYAHQNLVVHRDIKPSNILVTADGVPKLLDFGIAKLLNPELSSQTIAATATAVRLMTPEYASPEQFRGEPITTASDVYSLGVLLYRLLTGHRPYQFKSYLPQEIERAICEEEPEKPSTAISRVEEVPGPDDAAVIALTPEMVSKTREGQPEKLRRRLAGDLDNIVLMAIRKEPQRRYGSVEQLSEDIRRHLEGLPVIARKDTLGYRTGKFIRRHKVAVGVAAAFLVLVIGVGVALAVQSARIARERDKAEQVSAFLVNLFKVSDPSEARGNTITAREILDKGAEKIVTDLKDQPEVQATLMDTMGDVYQNLGLYDRATPLLEEALNIRRHIFGEEHPDVAESLNKLALLLDAKGDYAAAEPLYRQALAMRRKLLGEEHPDVAASINNLASLLYAKGDYAAAEPLFREALALHRKLEGNDHPNVASSLNNLAMVLRYKGDYAAAEPLLRQALARRRKLLGEDHPDVATSVNNLAWLLYAKGDSAAAEPLFREALALHRKLLGEDHPLVALSLNNLATLLYTEGDSAAAEPLFREALAMRRKLLGNNHPDVAASLIGLGRLLTERGDPQAAKPLLHEGLEIRRQTLPADHWLTANAESVLGDCLAALRRYNEAEPLLVKSYSILKAKRGEEDKSTQQALNRIINLYQAWGKPDKAAPYRARLSEPSKSDSAMQ